MDDLRTERHNRSFVYLVGPYSPLGGGMYKVMDYILQAGSHEKDAPHFKILDSRGTGTPAMSLLSALKTVIRLIVARAMGRVAGVHVNMAERLSVARKGIIILTARALGIPVILHLHAAQLPQFYSSIPRWTRFLVRTVFACANEVVVLGETARQFVVGTLRVPPSRVSLLTNGVPGPDVEVSARTREKLHIVFLGNLSERKGVSDLLNALARPEVTRLNWRATLAGGGDVTHYRHLCRRNGLESRVSLPGWCSQEQSGALLADADILVLPSYDEGLPLVILEAFSRSVAVICTPVGEIPNRFKHLREAYFVPPGHTSDLASAITQLLTCDELRTGIGSTARVQYEQCYSLSVFFAALMTIYVRNFGQRDFHSTSLSERAGDADRSSDSGQRI